ncbi:heterokaryon incompatibility protein-domain-containing protein [Rhypophila decipiens]|uniref:Heterokaryon incompatibility protein-domain-containing protein n=1 Tax=Rhypophila decipiens TaxID=261697 RepID=A0AAN7B361_9PEZI|nr:heterokaryon incompatibility protein-domain-containing protein [Rhypophila decipiens]
MPPSTSTFTGYTPLTPSKREIRLLTIPPAAAIWSPLLPLKSLRCRSTKRILWVDAVCINQTDIPEHNAQVSQMRHIYEGASSVAVFLGDATADSHKGLDFLRLFAAKVRACSSGAEADGAGLFKTWLTDVCIAASDAQEQAWLELARLLQRPYRTRAWIYQEMVLARQGTVYVGKDSISWDDAETVAFAIDALEDFLMMVEPLTNETRVVVMYHHFFNAALARAQRKAFGRAGAPTLLEALCVRRPTDATDPRDNVYSLLGVVKNHFIGLPELPSGEDVVIDYSRPVEKVYKDVVRHIVKKTNSLNILCACQNPDRTNGLPSLGAGLACQAHKRSVFYMDPPDDDTFVVRGVYVDSVTATGEEYTYGRDWEELKENWESLAMTCAWTFESAAEAGPCYLTTESISQAFFQTVTMRKIEDNEVPDIKVHIARIEAIERRSFFVTEKGFMALGPAETKVGDRVVVLEGMHVPTVLRKDEVGDGHAVVGEAYVHGLMNGEEFSEDMADGFESTLGRRLEAEKFLLR